MNISVGELEKALFKLYPASDAEAWDRVGLSVGNPEAKVTKIALALDVTVDTLSLAHDMGANTLIAHHPIFIEPPYPIIDKKGGGINPSSAVFEAIKLGVNVISMHTNLDRSQSALSLSAKLLESQYIDTFSDGLGSINVLEKEMTLKDFSIQVKHAFGQAQSVWGNPNKLIKNYLWFSGSASSAAKEAAKRGNIDCLLCGECSYHNALDAYLSDLSIIMLGHDISEQPFKSILKKELLAFGFVQTDIVDVDQKQRWFTI